MAAVAACEAALPLLQAALSSAGSLIPQDFSGRAFLNVGDAAGLLFSVQGGHADVELWSPPARPPTADTSIRFDSVDSLRRALQDQSAVPLLLMRKKLRLQGDMSMMAQLGPGDSSSNALAKEFARELDTAIAAATRSAATTSAAAGRLRRPSTASVASVASTATCTAWVPNEASPCCQECSKAFTPFRRRHHCRFCGRLLCHRCAPKVQVDENQDCFGAGQGRHGLRRCARCEDGFDVEEVPVQAVLPSSRRSSVTSAHSSMASDAAEAAMERLQALKEEVEHLRRAEQRRLEHSVQKGFLQIWVVTNLLLILITLLIFSWRTSVLGLWLAMLFALHRCPDSSLLKRNVRVFWAASVVTVAVLITRWKLRSLNLTEGGDYRAEWDATHEVLARFLYQQILKLKGFWIKLGQQLSVNVVLAAPYRHELGKLQDKIPAMPVKDVKLTLREEFGPEVAEQIFLDEGPPLGTASIAQVHRAIWKPKGQAHQEIVVKVQHRNVAPQFFQDLRNAQVLAKLLALVDPEGVPDLRPIVQSLREVTVKELDFRLEAENQERAIKAAETYHANVLIPKVVKELVSRKAMAMDYVDGEPLPVAAQRLTQEQRNRIIGAMVDHFAVQFVLDGHFHADPHPGNLMVQKGSERLVVLDWGMCITLPPEKARGYGELFVAAATSNSWRLVEAMKVIGITFKEGDVFEPLMFLNFTRFCSRETQPVEEAKGQVEGFMKAGDDLYQRGPKRFKKSPFDVMSGDMTYFLKALDLLWCVSSQLHARHPVMQTMFDRSMAALVPRSPPRLLPPLGSITAGCAASAASTGGRSRASLQDRLGQLLEEFYDQGDLLGAQLCVLRVGRRPPKVLADLALGVCGWLQQEMVTPSTLFNLLDISKLIVSFALLDLLRRKKLKLSDQLPLKPPVTVEQVLSHRSGYWQLLPPEIQHLSQLDWEQLLKAWQSCEAIEAPNHAQRYHHSSFGYLCTLAAGGTQNFLEAWDEVCRSGAQMAAELSLDAPPLSLTVPSGAAVAAPQGEVTTPDFAEIADMVANVYVLLGEVKEEANGRSCAETARKELFGREHLLDRSLFSLPETQSKIMPGLQSFGTSRALCALLGAMERQLPEDALRSRKDSHSGVEELATEVEPLLSLEEFQDFGLGIQLVPSSYWRDTKDGPRPGQVPYQSLESFIGETAEEPQAAWGHLAQNGSFVLMLPHQEQPMVVSLLLNMSGRKKSGPKVAKAVLRAIHQHR